MDIEHDKQARVIHIVSSEGAKILRSSSGTITFIEDYLDYIIETLEEIKQKIEKERPK